MSVRAAARWLWAAALAAACARADTQNQGAATRPIAEVLAAHQDSLLALPGVVGVGVGECQGAPCLIVMAAKRSSELERRLPKTLEGYPVQLRVTGTFTARPAAGGSMAFTLTSKAFAANASIPKKHTCDGPDVSPPLTWGGTPTGTKAFALINDDPDAPRPGGWVHWVLYDLPGNWVELPENVPKEEAVSTLGGARQGKNDFGRIGFNGSCPPPGKPHHYHFKLYALDAALGLKPGATRSEVERAMQGHVLGIAEIVGIYQRR